MKAQNQPPQLMPPHDIAELEPFPPQWKFWLLVGLGAIFVLGVVFFAVRKLLQKRPRTEPAPTLVKTEKPEKVLMTKLQQLNAATPFSVEAREQFFFELSLILRGFIEVKTSLRATDMTYQEIENGLARERSALSDEEVDQCLQFLAKADDIKFAGEEIGVVQAERYKEEVLGWVRTLAGGMLR